MRNRKLLLHRREIEQLQAKVATKGLTLIPLKLYLKGGKAKLELGLCRGKKLYDKREAIAERVLKHEMNRVIRRGYLFDTAITVYPIAVISGSNFTCSSR